MMLLLVVLLEIYLRELRTESIYLPLKSPLFRKEGAGGDLTTATYLKLISPTSLQKRGFFMILLLMILLGIYLRELRTENVYEAIISSPLFRKEGAGGRFNYFNLSKTNFPIISICAFSAFNAGI